MTLPSALGLLIRLGLNVRGTIGRPTPGRCTSVISGTGILMAKAPSDGKMAMSTLAGGETARCTAKALLHSPMETSTLVLGSTVNFSGERSTASKQKFYGERISALNE